MESGLLQSQKIAPLFTIKQEICTFLIELFVIYVCKHYEKPFIEILQLRDLQFRKKTVC